MTVISVVIPFHNEIRLIGRAVRSISNQNLSFIREIIIVNDGKLEDSYIYNQIILESSIDVPLTVIPNNWHKGPGGARNTGIELSTGNIIAFLDADDTWSHNKIQCQYHLFESKGATFVAGAYQYSDRPTVISPPSEVKSELDLLVKQGIGTSTVLVTRELIGKTRFTSRRFCQDIEFWADLSSKELFCYSSTDSIVATYSTGGSSKNKLVQLFYFAGFLITRPLPPLNLLFILLVYVSRGLSNHLIKVFSPYNLWHN